MKLSGNRYRHTQDQTNLLGQSPQLDCLFSADILPCFATIGIQDSKNRIVSGSNRGHGKSRAPGQAQQFFTGQITVSRTCGLGNMEFSVFEMVAIVWAVLRYFAIV